MTPPSFWFRESSPIAHVLSIFGFLYGYFSARSMNRSPRYRAPIPVICCGNYILGGAGKTPTCIALAKIAQSMNLTVGFLSRGYCGTYSDTCIVSPDTHTSAQVGDEPLLLSRHAICVVSRHRPRGAALLSKQNVDLIIMDDGFQNPHLYKNYNFVLLDSSRSIGNGYCLPAGPLRAPLHHQLKHTNAIISVDGESPLTLPSHIELLRANRTITNAAEFQSNRYLAYSGIADPIQFFQSLENCGVDIPLTRSFPDHHNFTDSQCRALISEAKTQNLRLATSEKDAVRLLTGSHSARELYESSHIVKMHMEFENPNRVQSLLQTILTSHSP